MATLTKMTCLNCGKEYECNEKIEQGSVFCRDCSVGGVTEPATFNLPEPVVGGDLRYPKGFLKYRLSAAEIEAYCLGYGQCQADNRETVSDIMTELIMLRAEIKERRKTENGTRRKLASFHMSVRKNHLKDEVRKRATESMTNINIIKNKFGLKYRVDMVVNKIRYTRTFNDLDTAMNYRNEHKFLPILMDAQSNLTDEERKVLQDAQRISQKALDVDVERRRNEKRGHKHGKPNLKNTPNFNDFN